MCFVPFQGTDEQTSEIYNGGMTGRRPEVDEPRSKGTTSRLCLFVELGDLPVRSPLAELVARVSTRGMRQRALGAHQGALEKERARTPPLPQRERRIDGGCGALACVGQVVDETR